MHATDYSKMHHKDPNSGKQKCNRTRAIGSAWLLPLLGLVSLIWFLVRVIPKPSRAAYPCQRAAAPMAAGFITWLVGLGASTLILRKASRVFLERRYALALLCLTFGAVVAGWSFFSMPPERAEALNFTPTDAPNTPMGTAKGIFPGRVVWVHNPDATSWNGTSGNYWDAGNTSQAVVDQMMSLSLRALTGTSDDDAAWGAFFRYYNNAHGKGSIGYQTGEKIAVKINTAPPYVSPQVALALLRQLVNHAGVPVGKITCYDVAGDFPDHFFNYCRAEFPTLRFVDFFGGGGRERRVTDASAPVNWSWGTGQIPESGGGYATHLPTCVTEADYIINLASLKGHSLAGVTLCFKNNYGSFCSFPDNTDVQGMPKGAGVHPYVAAHDFAIGDPSWEMHERPMGTYNSLVDLMGHPKLGAKTLLFLLDALYVGKDQSNMVNSSCRWQSAPFNNDWTSSVFASLDPVAIDSVGVDFLRSEPTMNQVYGTVDNYLHEAAQANNPPSGTFYDPAVTGTRFASLGVHEHWNNSAKKLYSRNLHIGNGIEFVGFSPSGNILPSSRSGATDWRLYD